MVTSSFEQEQTITNRVGAAWLSIPELQKNQRKQPATPEDLEMRKAALIHDLRNYLKCTDDLQPIKLTIDHLMVLRRDSTIGSDAKSTIMRRVISIRNTLIEIIRIEPTSDWLSLLNQLDAHYLYGHWDVTDITRDFYANDEVRIAAVTLLRAYIAAELEQQAA